MEDEFLLTQIRAKAKSLTTGEDRDQYFWTVIYKLVCKERAYKTVLNENNIRMSVTLALVDTETLPPE